MTHDSDNKVIALEDIFDAVGDREIKLFAATPKEALNIYRDKILDLLNMLDSVINDHKKMTIRPNVSLQSYIYAAWPHDSTMFPPRRFIHGFIGNKISKVLYVAEKIADARISLATSGAMRYPWSEEAPMLSDQSNYKTGFF